MRTATCLSKPWKLIVSILLAVVEIYGVIALLFVPRTQEFGIRIALGARRGQVPTMVVWIHGWRCARSLPEPAREAEVRATVAAST